MERLFDEDVLLGGGWTVHESLRPLAYSTLADLVHHVRQLLPLTDLAIAAHLFSKNVHDESLPTRYVYYFVNNNNNVYIILYLHLTNIRLRGELRTDVTSTPVAQARVEVTAAAELRRIIL